MGSPLIQRGAKRTGMNENAGESPAALSLVDNEAAAIICVATDTSRYQLVYRVVYFRIFYSILD